MVERVGHLPQLPHHVVQPADLFQPNGFQLTGRPLGRCVPAQRVRPAGQEGLPVHVAHQLPREVEHQPHEPRQRPVLARNDVPTHRLHRTDRQHGVGHPPIEPRPAVRHHRRHPRGQVCQRRRPALELTAVRCAARLGPGGGVQQPGQRAQQRSDVGHAGDRGMQRPVGTRPGDRDPALEPQLPPAVAHPAGEQHGHRQQRRREAAGVQDRLPAGPGVGQNPGRVDHGEQAAGDREGRHLGPVPPLVPLVLKHPPLPATRTIEPRLVNDRAQISTIPPRSATRPPPATRQPRDPLPASTARPTSSDRLPQSTSLNQSNLRNINVTLTALTTSRTWIKLSARERSLRLPDSSCYRHVRASV